MERTREKEGDKETMREIYIFLELFLIWADRRRVKRIAFLLNIYGFKLSLRRVTIIKWHSVI